LPSSSRPSPSSSSSASGRRRFATAPFAASRYNNNTTNNNNNTNSTEPMRRQDSDAMEKRAAYILRQPVPPPGGTETPPAPRCSKYVENPATLDKGSGLINPREDTQSEREKSRGGLFDDFACPNRLESAAPPRNCLSILPLIHKNSCT
jgi:hypothetical protein